MADTYLNWSVAFFLSQGLATGEECGNAWWDTTYEASGGREHRLLGL